MQCYILMRIVVLAFFTFFFFNDTATTEIYTLSLHDALPIFPRQRPQGEHSFLPGEGRRRRRGRSEEHTSELQSHLNLVCRLLLEKKKGSGNTIDFGFTYYVETGLRTAPFSWCAAHVSPCDLS